MCLGCTGTLGHTASLVNDELTKLGVSWVILSVNAHFDDLLIRTAGVTLQPPTLAATRGSLASPPATPASLGPFLSLLPEDVLFTCIFGRLDLSSIGRMACVCRRMRWLLRDTHDEFWRAFVLRSISASDTSQFLQSAAASPLPALIDEQPSSSWREVARRYHKPLFNGTNLQRTLSCGHRSTDDPPACELIWTFPGAMDTFLDALCKPGTCGYGIFQAKDPETGANWLCFIGFYPEQARIKQRMIHASTKDSFLRKLRGVAIELAETERGGVEAGIKEKMAVRGLCFS